MQAISRKSIRGTACGLQSRSTWARITSRGASSGSSSPTRTTRPTRRKGAKPGAHGWSPGTYLFDFNQKYSWRNVGFEQTDDHPVVCVSWNDAVTFCKWLSKKESKSYRLPTEAEWEYSCRAGTTTRYYSGDDPETLAKVGNVRDAAFEAKYPWYKGTTKASDGYVFTAPVGRFKPNAFGLYDLHGNAWQWCSDWYGEEYYAKSAVDDPTGPDSGEVRCFAVLPGATSPPCAVRRPLLQST